MAFLNTRSTSLLLVGWIANFLMCSAKQDPLFYCGACLALTEEMGWEIARADKRTTIETGSFRIDSKGNQGTVGRPYKRSELHLVEVLETVCNNMQDYALSTDPDSGFQTFIRTSSRVQGQPVSLTNVHMSSENTGKLRFACDTIIEEHEDTIMSLFKEEKTSKMPGEHLCVTTAEYCSPSDFRSHLMVTAQSVLQGQKEEREKEEEDEEDDDEEDDDDDEEDEDDEEGEEDEDEEDDVNDEL